VLGRAHGWPERGGRYRHGAAGRGAVHGDSINQRSIS